MLALIASGCSTSSHLKRESKVKCNNNAFRYTQNKSVGSSKFKPVANAKPLKSEKYKLIELEYLFPSHLEVIQKVKKIKSLKDPFHFSSSPSPEIRK